MIIEKIGVGDTIEEARENARNLLNAPEDADIKFDIITAPSKKILGLFGGKKAEVKASYEKKEAPKKKASVKAKAKKAEKKAENKPIKKVEPKAAPKKEEPKKEPLSPQRLKQACEDCTPYVKDIVEKIIDKEIEVESEIADENTIFITIKGENNEADGIIIGHRGETLDAIQYLASLKANKGHDDYVRVTLDISNYREKRQETLISLANRNAKNALRTGRRITLEPMNPYERHIIHTAVQEIEGVSSHSVGSNIDRRVVITPDNYNPSRKNQRKNYSRSSAPVENREPKKDTNSAPLYGIVTKKETEEE